MKSDISSINSLVLVLVAFSSLLSMFALTRIDNIVHQDLYRYGLRFSYKWAMPYWTMTTLVFIMGWFNIIITCAFQFYVLLYGRKEAPKPETRYQPSIEEKPVETAEAETKEMVAPPMEVELETRREGEEAQGPTEEPKEEQVTVVEAPQGYMETRQPEEAEEQETPVAPSEEPIEATEEAQEVGGQWEEQGTGPRETVETEPEHEESFEGPQEPVDARLEEETSYVGEEEREQEEKPRETVETEDTPSSAPETEAETTESEETQPQEAELTEHYPT